MELGVIVELITTIGFPIVCVLALGYFVWVIYKQSVVREEKLMGEIAENRKVNEQFAQIIGQYEVTLGEIKTDVKEIKETLQITE
jgi:F0F1-type ATP synthase membrane subunit b/b'